MKLATSQQMKAIDNRAIHEWQIPEIVLMENAGMALSRFLQEKFDRLSQMTVTIVAGCGNNGGDGLVLARHLYNLGCNVKVFLVAERPFSESAQCNLNIIEKLPIKIYRIDNPNSIHLFKATLNYTDIIIDAILGTGTNRPVSPLIEEVLAIINKRTCIKVAVDVPSGLNADDGSIWGAALKADYTVTFALFKRGLLLNEGLRLSGEVVCADIGIPRDVIDSEAIRLSVLDKDYLRGVIKPREKDSHKGTYGHLLTIGGSKGMSGSVVLCNGAALRAGVGLVTSAVPENIYLPVAVMQPEVMVHSYAAGAAGGLSLEALPQLKALLSGKSALVIGPGLGHDEELFAPLAEILRAAQCPVVIDADGLNLLAGRLNVLETVTAPVILTPHPGEMARLCNTTTAEVQANRLQMAQDFAKAHGVYLVLKGFGTIIAAPDGECWLNTVDSPALAVAGSGDVLAGIIGAFLAQGMAYGQACAAAVNLHGQAGLLVAAEKGEVSSQAGDLPEAIYRVLSEVVNS